MRKLRAERLSDTPRMLKKAGMGGRMGTGGQVSDLASAVTESHLRALNGVPRVYG